MDIKDIIELSKNGYTPSDIKELLTLMRDEDKAPSLEPEPAPAPEATAQAQQSSGVEGNTQALIDAVNDLKKTIQASNITKDTGAPAQQSVEEILASLVR